jgi:hypothetical protein
MEEGINSTCLMSCTAGCITSLWSSYDAGDSCDMGGGSEVLPTPSYTWGVHFPFLDIHQHTIPQHTCQITMMETPPTPPPRRSPRKHNTESAPEDTAARRELKFNQNKRKNVAPSDDALDDDDNETLLPMAAATKAL